MLPSPAMSVIKYLLAVQIKVFNLPKIIKYHNNDAEHFHFYRFVVIKINIFPLKSHFHSRFFFCVARYAHHSSSVHENEADTHSRA